MHFASALSLKTTAGEIARDLAAQLAPAWPTTEPDLICLFVTMPIAPDLREITQYLHTALKPKAFFGSAAESVLGASAVGAFEIEQVPAAAALVIHLPEARVATFTLEDESWESILTDPVLLRAAIGADDELRTILLLGDPFTTPIVQLLDACSNVYPEAPVIGGMASGIRQKGEARLLIGDQIVDSGAVGVTISGPVGVDSLVSQGCRPLGAPFTVTRAEENVINELNGQPSLAQLEHVVSSLSLADRTLLQTNGLQLGRAIAQSKGTRGRGDFLIRSVLDFDRQSGAMVIGDLAEPGHVVQFYVRDAASADEELRLLLQGELMLASPPHGVLLFTCAGRGSRLFRQPHHDVQAARELLGPVPIAGMFCAGELGPVGSRNFIHSQSASFALFRSLQTPSR